MGILFGSVTSVLFSAMGALLSYGGLWLGAIALKRKCSYIGLGVLCAALHNLGQLIAAALLFGSGVLLSYLPALMLASLIFGSAGGWILNAAVRRLPKERRML
jgi:heptaprenyl diphosphate synthase